MITESSSQLYEPPCFWHCAITNWPNHQLKLWCLPKKLKPYWLPLEWGEIPKFYNSPT